MGVCTKQLCKIGHGGKCRVMFIGCCKLAMSHLRLGFNEITYIDISFFWMMSTDPEIVDCRDWMFLDVFGCIRLIVLLYESQC